MLFIFAIGMLLTSLTTEKNTMLFGKESTFQYTDNSNFNGTWEIKGNSIIEKNSKGVQTSKFEALDESTDQFTIKVISSDRELLQGFVGETATVLKSYKDGEIQLAAETRNGVIKATLK